MHACMHDSTTFGTHPRASKVAPLCYAEALNRPVKRPIRVGQVDAYYVLRVIQRRFPNDHCELPQEMVAINKVIFGS